MNYTFYSPKKPEFGHKIVKTIATLSKRGSYRTILGIVQFGNAPAKFDIRTWQTDADGVETACKGKSLSIDEMRNLQDALKDYEIPDTI